MNFAVVLHKDRLKLWYNQTVSDLFEDIADIPLPPPNQWDPSRMSVLLSFFSRTPGILWLQRGIRNQSHYWLVFMCNTVWLIMIPIGVRQCRTKHHIRYPEWNTACSDVHGPLWKPITPISSHTALFHVVVKKKWQLKIGFTCTMFHPQIVYLSDEIHFMLKHFRSKAFCRQTLVWRHCFLCVGFNCHLSCTKHQKECFVTFFCQDFF